MPFRFDFGAARAPAPPPSPPPPPPPPRQAAERAREFVPARADRAPRAASDTVRLDSLLLRKSLAAPPPSLSPTRADIVPAVYEGGYKLWECALDLALYLRANPALCARKSVLELGAGHAIPAIVAAIHGAASLHLHDYNQPVLRDVTVPNVVANVPDVAARYFCGAWCSLPPVLARTFDLVLSADTVYAQPQCQSLADCICQCLAENAVALVAAKTYYFGVGGGTAAFRHALRHSMSKHRVHLHVDVVAEMRDGQSNVREILQVRRLSRASPDCH